MLLIPVICYFNNLIKNAMANTYAQIHIQMVFSVQNRHCHISDKWKDELYRYIAGIVRNNNHKLLAINGMPDHIHILIGLRPSQSLSELMKDIKGDSSKWINEKRLVKGRFSWQEGYGAFSYCRGEIIKVIQYINNQLIHHRGKKFLEEYKVLLDEFGIEYDEKFLFKEV
jgi:putative transposase